MLLTLPPVARLRSLYMHASWMQDHRRGSCIGPRETRSSVRQGAGLTAAASCTMPSITCLTRACGSRDHSFGGPNRDGLLAVTYGRLPSGNASAQDGLGSVLFMDHCTAIPIVQQFQMLCTLTKIGPAA